MKQIWLKKAEEIKRLMNIEFIKTGSIDSKKMNTYMNFVDTSERCSE